MDAKIQNMITTMQEDMGDGGFTQSPSRMLRRRILKRTLERYDPELNPFEIPVDDAKEALEKIVQERVSKKIKSQTRVCLGDAANKIVEKSEVLQGKKKPKTTQPEPEHKLGSSL